MFTGKTEDALTKTHRINGMSRTNLYLCDTRGGTEVILRLTRVEE